MSKKLKITDREWREFSVVGLFDLIERGRRITQQHRVYGFTPLVTAGESLNGISSFINNQEQRTFKRGITLDMFANTFYQNYPFKCDDNITVLLLAEKSAYVHLFLVVMLTRLKEKYSYAKQVRPHRLKREYIMLPIQADGTPDWAFMEAYMKQVEEEHLSEVLPKLEAQLLQHIITLGALEDREWKEFTLTDFFSPIKGNQNNMSSLIEGEFPLISAKKWSNGVKAFVSPNNKGLFPQHCITLNLDGDGGAGLAYYQGYSFALDSHVAALYPKLLLDRFSLLFIARSISAQRFRFGHGRAINKSRLNHFLITLPIQPDGTPDWDFMSGFMKKVEHDTLSEALRHFKPKKYKRMLTGGVE